MPYMELIEKNLKKYDVTGWKMKAMATSSWKQIVRAAYDRQI
jgi:hypothetical protein